MKISIRLQTIVHQEEINIVTQSCMTATFSMHMSCNNNIISFYWHQFHGHLNKWEKLQAWENISFNLIRTAPQQIYKSDLKGFLGYLIKVFLLLLFILHTQISL